MSWYFIQLWSQRFQVRNIRHPACQRWSWTPSSNCGAVPKGKYLHWRMNGTTNRLKTTTTTHRQSLNRTRLANIWYVICDLYRLQGDEITCDWEGSQLIKGTVVIKSLGILEVHTAQQRSHDVIQFKHTQHKTHWTTHWTAEKFGGWGQE